MESNKIETNEKLNKIVTQEALTTIRLSELKATKYLGENEFKVYVLLLEHKSQYNRLGDEAPPITQSEIAERLDLKQPYVSNAVGGLEDKHLIDTYRKSGIRGRPICYTVSNIEAALSLAKIKNLH